MMVESYQPTRAAVRHGFEATGLDEHGWRGIGTRGATWSVFQELRWQLDWWHSYGRGELFVVAARNAAGRIVAIASWFIDGGMGFLVGSGGSDYLDFVGDTAAPGTIEALLAPLLDAHPELLGLRLYHVPDSSPTGARLRAAAQRLGLRCHDEDWLLAPALATGASGAAALAAASHKSLVRHERRLARDGNLRVAHLRTADAIVPWLDVFFAQHVARWARTASPSLFESAVHRDFYRRLAGHAGDAGADFIRFTVVEWCQRPIAFHFGFSHAGRYLWYKPSFDTEFARYSPGEVLLRQLFIAAVREDAAIFDFGLGDEAFKSRFCDRRPVVRNWGLYRG